MYINFDKSQEHNILWSEDSFKISLSTFSFDASNAQMLLMRYNLYISKMPYLFSYYYIVYWGNLDLVFALTIMIITYATITENQKVGFA